jgi:hypothetical protein
MNRTKQFLFLLYHLPGFLEQFYSLRLSLISGTEECPLELEGFTAYA